MTNPKFAGDQKVGHSILTIPEKKLVAWGIPKIPAWMETYHLTMLTLLWSVGNAGFGYLARQNLHWLWMVSLMIVLQYITDLYDGAIGRHRNTGLVKWGFYMDHFLDYIFMTSLVLAGYMISPPGLGIWYVVLMILMGSFMANSFLSFAATNEFEIYYKGIGPTEMRIVFILVNTVIIFTGTWHFIYTLPAVCLVMAVTLVYLVFRMHKRLWAIDMANKQTKT